MKFGFNIFENLSRKLKFRYSLTRIAGTLHEDQYTNMIISRSFLVRMRNVSEKFAQKTKTRFMLNNFFFFEKTCCLGQNVENYCSARQATNTHSEYVIIIVFPLPQCLQERASMLRYTCRYYLFVDLLAQVTMT